MNYWHWAAEAALAGFLLGNGTILVCDRGRLNVFALVMANAAVLSLIGAAATFWFALTP